ncbi:MAG: hypothetical protein ACK44A_03575 [Roseateles sp.]
MANCECTARCGDDPDVIARRRLGCQTYRARRNPDHLGALLEAALVQVNALVDLLDRMEPEVPDELRASDEEWIDIKAKAKQFLEQVE